MEKSFVVTSGGHRFKFVSEDIGYSVSEIGVRGVNTQGDTFEEALANAHEASRLMAELRDEMRKAPPRTAGAAGRKKAGQRTRSRRRAGAEA